MRRHVPRRWDTGRKHQAGRSQGCQRKPANDLPASDLHGSPKVNRLFHAVYPAGVPGPFESSRRAQRATTPLKAIRECQELECVAAWQISTEVEELDNKEH
jgi:hypothetical protein